MARRPALFFDAELDTDTSSVSPAEAGGATMTLVKPVLPEDTSRMSQPQPRPKFGLLSTDAKTLPTLESSTHVEDEETIEPEQDNLLSATHDWKLWDTETTQGWDYKFAAALVALLVIVNTGLIFLLHNDKGTESVVEAPHVAALPVQAVQPVATLTPPPAPVSTATSAPAPVVAAPVMAPTPTPVVQHPAPQAAVAAIQPSAASRQDLLSILTKE